MVDLWNSFVREVVESLTLGFKTWLHTALSSLLQVTLLWAGVGLRWSPEVPATSLIPQWLLSEDDQLPFICSGAAGCLCCQGISPAQLELAACWDFQIIFHSQFVSACILTRCSHAYLQKPVSRGCVAMCKIWLNKTSILDYFQHSSW